MYQYRFVAGVYLGRATAHPVKNMWVQNTNRMFVPQLRWDRADLGFYRLLTGSHFQSVLQDTINLQKTKDVHPDDIDRIYSKLVNILRVCSDTVVPACPKFFLNTGKTRKWTN